MIVRHSPAQDTPVPIYVCLQLHAHTRKRELIDNLCSIGIRISYDRVLWLSTDMGNIVCKMYELDMGLVFHCYSIKCRKMMLLYVVQFLLKDYLHQNWSIIYPIITLMCHQFLLESKVHLYLLELLSVSKEMTTNLTKKRKMGGWEKEGGNAPDLVRGSSWGVRGRVRGFFWIKLWPRIEVRG